MILLSRILAFLGCIAAMLPICYGRNYALTLFVITVLFTLWGTRVFVREYVIKPFYVFERKPVCVITIILLVGILLRILVGGVWHYWENAEPQYSPWSDSFVFWEQAKQFATGFWPDTKSWSTTFLYGMLIKVFGENAKILIITNVILQSMTTMFLFLIVFKYMGLGICGGGIVAAFVFWSPTMIFYSFFLYAEHIYFLLVVVGLSLMFRSAMPNIRNAVFSFCAMCCVIWIAVWTRAEGVLLWGALTTPVLIVSITTRWKKCCFFLCCMGFLFGIGVVFAQSVNGGQKSFFCSSDSWWPRLHGSCVESGGQFGGGRSRVYELAAIRYPNRTFKYQLGYCPRELIPIIDSEIHRRWREMDICTIMKFVLKKELRDFGGERINFYRKNWLSLTINELFPICVSVLALVYFSGVVFGRYHFPPLFWAPLLIVLGTAVVLSITESLPRYGFIIEIMFPFYAAITLCGMFSH